MAIVLDTGVFYHPDALRSAALRAEEIVVPTVVFMERGRQLARDGGDVEAFARRLRADRYILAPFDEAQARRYAIRVKDDRLWRAHFRDAMIAGHVGPGDILWTTNRRDFEAIGVPARQIVDVPAPQA